MPLSHLPLVKDHDDLKQSSNKSAIASEERENIHANDKVSSKRKSSRKSRNQTSDSLQYTIPKLTQRAIRVQMRSLSKQNNSNKEQPHHHRSASRGKLIDSNQQLLTTYYGYIKNINHQISRESDIQEGGNFLEHPEQSGESPSVYKKRRYSEFGPSSIADHRSTVTGFTCCPDKNINELFSQSQQKKRISKQKVKDCPRPNLLSQPKIQQKPKLKTLMLCCLKSSLKGMRIRGRWAAKFSKRQFTIVQESDLQFQSQIDRLIQRKQEETKALAEIEDVQVPIENVADQDVDTDEDNMKNGKHALLSELEAAIIEYQKDSDAIDHFDHIPEYVIQNNQYTDQEDRIELFPPEICDNQVEEQAVAKQLVSQHCESSTDKQQNKVCIMF